jgi:hypothetical protein
VKCARETRGIQPALTRRSPFLTLPYPACEVGVLERHGVGEGEGELGADFTSFFLPRLSCQVVQARLIWTHENQLDIRRQFDSCT